jgi:hypothetical protein
MAGDGEEIRSTLFGTTDKIPIVPILMGRCVDPVLFSSLFYLGRLGNYADFVVKCMLDFGVGVDPA